MAADESLRTKNLEERLQILFIDLDDIRVEGRVLDAGVRRLARVQKICREGAVTRLSARRN